MPPVRAQFGHRRPPLLASLFQTLLYPPHNASQIAQFVRASVRGGFGQLLHEVVHVGGRDRRPWYPDGVPDQVGHQPDIPHVGDTRLPAQVLGQLKDVDQPAPQPVRTACAGSAHAVAVPQFYRVSQPVHILIIRQSPLGRRTILARGPPLTQQLTG